MPETIANFLVGMGLDTSQLQKGAKSALREIDSMRAAILQTNAAAGKFDLKGLGSSLGDGFDVGRIGRASILGSVASAAGTVATAVGGIAVATAKATNELSYFSQIQSISLNDLQSLSFAYQKFGGNLQEVMSDIRRFDELRTLTPDAIGAVFQDLGIRGIDASQFIYAENAIDAMMKLSDIMDGVSKDKRLQINQAFGLSGTSLILMSKGRKEISSTVDHFDEMSRKSEKLIEQSKELNEQWVNLKANTTGLFNDIAEDALPVVNALVKGANDFVSKLREAPLVAESTKTVGSPMALVGAGSVASGEFPILKNFISWLDGNGIINKENSSSAINANYSYLSTAQRTNNYNLPDYLTTGTKPSVSEKTPIKIDVILDGRVLGTAVTDIMEEANNAAMNDLEVGGS